MPPTSLCSRTKCPLRAHLDADVERWADFKEIMSDQVKYFSKQELELKPDVDGAKMWAVSLEKTQFTYFEVEPNKNFERHSHESEQITYVLSGELFFEFENELICVKKGEIIAIPSNIPHAVFTKDLAAKAVDAWSPVMGKYSE